MFPRKLTKAAMAAGTALTLALGALGTPSQSHAGAQPYIGDIMYVGWNFATAGWSECNGQILAINSWQSLFSLLGTTYGGDGETTFALPDMRGRVPVHFGQGPGLSNYSMGQKGGEEQVTLTAAQLPSHNHSLHGTTSRGDESDPTGATIAKDAGERQFHNSAPPNVAMHASSIGSTGGDQSHENRMPYLVVRCTIALSGIFPSPP